MIEASITSNTGPSLSRPDAIAIVDARTLIRDCLALSLQEKLALPIKTYPDIASWREDPTRASACVIILGGPEETNVTSRYDALHKLSESRASPPVVVISDNSSTWNVTDALRHGAKGFIPTETALEVAAEAIGLVLAGGCFIPANILNSDQGENSGRPVDNATSDFTARENQVVAALLKGKSNKVIAYDTGLAESSVKYHIRSVLRKLSARNRTEAVTKLSELIRYSLPR